jgi:hypothetical protein
MNIIEITFVLDDFNEIENVCDGINRIIDEIDIEDIERAIVSLNIASKLIIFDSLNETEYKCEYIIRSKNLLNKFGLPTLIGYTESLNGVSLSSEQKKSLDILLKY